MYLWKKVCGMILAATVAACVCAAVQAEEEMLWPGGVYSSSELWEEGYDHNAWNLFDGDLSSSWTEGVSGTGVGEYVEILLPEDVKVTGGIIYPGFLKNEDLFWKNAAPSVIEISAAGGSTTIDCSTFTDSYSDACDGCYFWLGEELEHDGSIYVTIQEVRDGWKYTDTCLSELTLFGTGMPDEGMIDPEMKKSSLVSFAYWLPTRDAIDSKFENEFGKYTFIDTAGIRRKSKVDDRIEKFSVMRAKMAIERADVCLIMIDATEGVTDQDTKIAGLAHEAGKASIIVINKWDLVEKDSKTMENMRKDVQRELSFMSYAPIVFISALTGQRTNRLYELINYVKDQSCMRITTGMLNNVLADAQARVQPPTDKGRRLKIYYMTQTGIQPPNFVVFCNSRELFHFSYQRYLENQIRATFGLEGTPIRMVIRQKGDKE